MGFSPVALMLFSPRELVMALVPLTPVVLLGLAGALIAGVLLGYGVEACWPFPRGGRVWKVLYWLPVVIVVWVIWDLIRAEGSHLVPDLAVLFVGGMQIGSWLAHAHRRGLAAGADVA
jgi:hypothetical protein